jgi:hypothetical protein
MDIIEMVKNMRSNGLKLWVEGERLLCAPKEKIAEAQRQTIRTRKAEIIHLLARETARRKLGVFNGFLAKYTHTGRLPIPVSWKTELQAIEEAFSESWRAGRECRDEYIAIRDHWLSILRLAREQIGGLAA